MGGLVLVVLAAWAIGMRGATASHVPSGTSVSAAISATDLPTQTLEAAPTPAEAPATTIPPAPTAAPQQGGAKDDRQTTGTVTPPADTAAPPPAGPYDYE
jgi:hypothetical protein